MTPCQGVGRRFKSGPPLMYYVYILKSLVAGTYYVGSTNNIERRLLEHNSGKTSSLKSKRPLILIYKENFPTQIGARKREKVIKSYKGGNAFKKIIRSSSVVE